jgi:DNA repair protein RecO (recombination protein O)
VIRARDLGEADKVITLLSREEGKVQAVARGARRPRNRLAGVTQLFTHCNAALFSGRSLHTLSQAEIRDSFRPLREDLSRLAHATYICELVDEMVPEKQPQEALFHLLLATLHLFCLEQDLDPVLRAFELRLLSFLGFRPRFDSCVACGGAVAGSHASFAVALGGCVCPRCPPGQGPVVPLSRGSITTMGQLMDGDLRRVRVLRMTREVAAEVGRLLEDFIAYRLEKRLKSLGFLHTIRAT